MHKPNKNNENAKNMQTNTTNNETGSILIEIIEEFNDIIEKPENEKKGGSKLSKLKFDKNNKKYIVKNKIKIYLATIKGKYRYDKSRTYIRLLKS